MRPKGESGVEPAPWKVYQTGSEVDANGWFASPVESDGKFAPQDGFFLRMCVTAAAEPEKDFIVLLDELNRANVPKVIGDLLTTLEHSKRARWDESTSAWDITEAAVVSLPYSGRPFFVPANLYIVATMNTSDRSIASLDAALRRRFAFIHLDPYPLLEMLSVAKAQISKTAGISDAKVAEVLEDLKPSATIWDSLNTAVLLPCLGPDSVLGHSYLFGLATALVSAPPPLAAEWSEMAELSVLANCIGKGTTSGGAAIRRAIWLETGTTGGSGNQADLPKSGSKDATCGQPHLLLGTQMSPSESKEYKVRVIHNGAVVDTVVKYWGDAGSNHMWRWQQMPAGLAGSLVVLLESQAQEFEAHIVPSAALGALRSVSDWDTGANSPKSWGTIQKKRLATPGTKGVIQQAWRFEILPQLVESLVSAGADLLVDDSRRLEWFEAHTLPEVVKTEALSALVEFDKFIALIGLQVSVPGTGLGRVPKVSLAVPMITVQNS
jgi:hypothetical protein